MPDVS